MPRRFLDQMFSKAGLCALVLGSAFIFGCGGVAERETAALIQDSALRTRLTQIETSISTRKMVNPEEFSALKKIREKYPNEPDVRRVYKNALVIREDWVALEKLLTESGPGPDDERRMLGQAYFKLGRYAQSIETLGPLGEKAPDDLDLHSILAGSYYYLGQFSESAAELDRIWPKIVAEKRVAEMAIRGLVYMNQNDLAKAEETMTQAFEIDGANATVTNALVQLYARKGDSANADLFRQKTVELNEKRSADEYRSRILVQQTYELENAWNAKNFDDVIRRANQMLAATTDKNRRIVLYQYIYESHKNLGHQSESSGALAEIQKLKKQ
jgi:Flp pilus assembly protein TadD